MPEEEAKYHLKRCIDSGLWVPDGNKTKEATESEDQEETSEEVK